MEICLLWSLWMNVTCTEKHFGVHLFSCTFNYLIHIMWFVPASWVTPWATLCHELWMCVVYNIWQCCSFIIMSVFYSLCLCEWCMAGRGCPPGHCKSFFFLSSLSLRSSVIHYVNIQLWKYLFDLCEHCLLPFPLGFLVDKNYAFFWRLYWKAVLLSLSLCCCLLNTKIVVVIS